MLCIEHAHASTRGGNGSMTAGSDHGSAAKGSAIGLEVAGSGLVSCCFSSPSSLLCVVHYLVFHQYHHGTYVDHLH